MATRADGLTSCALSLPYAPLHMISDVTLNMAPRVFYRTSLASYSTFSGLFSIDTITVSSAYR